MAPDDELVEKDETARTEAESGDDTEGHNLGMVMAMNELMKGPSRPDPRQRRREDEELKPLTRRWPRFRNDKRG